MFISSFIFLLALFAEFNLNWLSLYMELLILQTLTLYYLYRLLSALNLYQLVGYSTLSLVIFAAYLFWLQFDVFACFLLVAESIVLLFVLSLLMHLNYTNLESKFTAQNIFIIFISVTCINIFPNSNFFSYWVDWYNSQVSQYNDLLPQFIYFYLIDSPVVVLTGVWLLVLTLLLVHLILSISLTRQTTTTTLHYTRKTQNIWTQWYKKPVLRFFKK